MTLATAMSPTGVIKEGMRNELLAIATDPDEDHYLEASFDTLSTQIAQVIGFICGFSESR